MFLECFFAGICVISAWLLYEDARKRPAGRAYILQNQITHTRLLPVASRHSFVYPTLSYLLSLDALETGQLNLLGGWLFSYGGIWGRVTGLRASAYLHDETQAKRSIRQKLVSIIEERGWSGDQLGGIWLMTMPSFLAVEGINPLTVYFCYRQDSPSLWLVVLEIHNTFGERTVHILETGSGEDAKPRAGFDYQWTFPRHFHVSPFNDRSGHYVLQIVAPSHPPCTPSDVPAVLPRPIVRLAVLTASPSSQIKLVALLRATNTKPFSNVHLLKALAKMPFGLLLVFSRILYQAFILHYYKRLDVYQRPEPLAPDSVIEAHLPAVQNTTQTTQKFPPGGIGWRQEGILERWCRNRIYTHLRNRCAETGISITFYPANPFEEKMSIARSGSVCTSTLSIYYRSPRLFTILFMAPSPEHALLFGSQAEKVFSVSSTEIFRTVFTASSFPRHSKLMGISTRIRRQLIPNIIDLPISKQHPLDVPVSLKPVIVLCMLWISLTVERKMFQAIGARFVPGDEPWGGWERLHAPDTRLPGGDVGSFRRKED